MSRTGAGEEFSPSCLSAAAALTLCSMWVSPVATMIHLWRMRMTKAASWPAANMSAGKLYSCSQRMCRCSSSLHTQPRDSTVVVESNTAHLLNLFKYNYDVLVLCWVFPFCINLCFLLAMFQRKAFTSYNKLETTWHFLLQVSDTLAVLHEKYKNEH